MAGGHAHPHPGSLDRRRADTRQRMWIALAINLAMLVAEAVGGVLTGSLALLADAGHVLSDVGAIGIGLIAGTLATASGSGRRTFGLQRSEVFAALINGLALVAVAVVVVIEAIRRLDDPGEIAGGGVIALGLFGLAGNLLATLVLAGGEREDLNLEGVLRHSAADALGSIGVVVAGTVVLTTGWEQIDPIASLLIAVLIAASSWRLLAEPFDVLMESAPGDIDVDELGERLCETPGVIEVHDLHVWTVTAGFDALAAHVVVRRGVERDPIRQRIEAMLRERYRLAHTTLQMEEEAEPGLLELERPGDF